MNTRFTDLAGPRRASIATVILIGVALAITAYFLVRAWEQGVIDAEFERRANNHAAVLQSTIDQHIELLESLAGLYIASNHVERSEFRRFVEPFLARHTEVQAYGWNPLVRYEERGEFEAAARREGLSGFQITEVDETGKKIPARRRGEYVAVYYLEPLSGNEQALGYDIASEDARREALDQARESGLAVTTRWIRLVQETEDQYGVLIVRPVYAEAASLESTRQRPRILKGYVVGVFRVGNMIEEALRPADPAGLDFWVYPDAEPEFPAMAYFHPSRSRVNEDTRPRFAVSDPHQDRHQHLALKLPGRQWTIVYKPAPALLAAHSRHAATGVLLSGLALTALLGFYLLSMLRESQRMALLNDRLASANNDLQHETIERQQAEKALSTSEQIYRTLIENAPEAITILDVQHGHLTEANQHAEQLFGMTREDLLSAGPVDFSPEYQPDGRRSDAAARKYIQCAVDGQTPVFEWMHLHTSGREIPCEVRLVRLPVPDRILVRGTIADIRDRRKAEGLQKRLGRILDNSTNEIFVFDAETLRFTQVNSGACHNLGYSAEELAEMTPVDIKPDFSEDRFRQRIEPLYSGREKQLRFSTVHERKDGTQYPVEVTLHLSHQEDPPVFVAIVQDITQRLEAESALRESEAYNRMLFEESTIGLVLCDIDGKLVDINPAFASILGRTVEQTKKLNYWDITPEKYNDDEKAQLESLERYGRYGPYEKEYIHKDGHLVPVRLTGRILVKDHRKYIWSSVEDITDYKQARDRIDHMAFHDALTNLPNRELLHDRLDHAISLARRNQTLVGVMFLDIDRFKTINDSLGHSVGDQLLIQIAERLTRHVREADTVARFGGDEFIVIAEGLSGQQQLESLAKGIIERMKAPFQIGSRELFVTTSIGIALASDSSTSVDSLIAQADIAMYNAKDSGRNNYQFHSRDMGERVSRRAAIESDLRGALERDELLFHLQPIMNLETQQPIGMEALMRWKHPKRGLVSPAEFIPVMEDSGLIVPASRWILQQSCRYLGTVHKELPQKLSVAVNFSAPCFYDAGIADFVKRTLADCGIEPRDLILEITESTLFRDPQRVRPVLESLKDMGVRIALDDFGTGQSSLSHLRTFPIDIVKIDRGFIRDVPDDKNDCELVSAIIAMAHNLNMCVVAEGVEQDAQLEFLLKRGCDRVQGYLFSPPLPGDEMLTYLLDAPESRSAADSF